MACKSENIFPEFANVYDKGICSIKKDGYGSEFNGGHIDNDCKILVNQV